MNGPPNLCIQVKQNIEILGHVILTWKEDKVGKTGL